DVVGFSLTYELNYATVANMLDLAGIPVYAGERNGDHPLIIAGGPSTMNPEPMADFFDLFAIGDAEEMIGDILGMVSQGKKERSDRNELLRKLGKIPGVYVPSLYEVKYDAENNFESLTPKLPDVPEKIKVRTVPQLKSEYYPPEPIVPFLETTHDRLTIEIMRGCPKRCRFCAATATYQPKRERSVEEIVKQAEIGIAKSGWDEISLLSLSTTDYSELPELAKTLAQEFSSKRVSVSLPSLRPGTFSPDLGRFLSQVKKSGLTFAPEAGTPRLRSAVGKSLNEEELLNTARLAFSSGWNLIKLYFMIGLPTEREEDLQGIADLLKRVLRVGKETGRTKNLNVTISPFTPKAHTPFQWEELEDEEGLQEKMRFLKTSLRRGNLKLKFRDPHVSFLEGVFSRGDRRLSSVIFSAWKGGAKLDGWTEHFNYELWKKAFSEAGIDPRAYTRARNPRDPLPWDHIDKGIRKEALRKERDRAHALEEDLAPDAEYAKEPGFPERPPSGALKISELVPAEKLEELQAPTEESVTPSYSYGRKKKRRPPSPAMTVARSRVRLKWNKSEEVRFTSHLDVGRTLERTIRRSGIPIAYSEGFHPHQKVAFAPPLPLGFVSDGEYLDIQLTEPYTSAVLSRLNQDLPSGFEFLEGKPIFGKSDSLSSIINLASYEVGLDLPLGEVEKSVKSILEKQNLWVRRVSKKQEVKEVDIRRRIMKLEPEACDDRVVLKMDLGLGTDGYVRPEEILVYGFGLEQREVVSLVFKRTGLFVLKDGQILTPMDVL
ncbi:MAG: TIGR03960 family B12-binding radical SAM protein, partial [Candidatus Zixiibacteriota bacterium]